MAILLAIPSIPQTFATTPTGIRTGKWKFTYTPTGTHTSVPYEWRFLFCSNVDGASIVIGGADPGSPGSGGHVAVYNGSYGSCVYQEVTWAASAALTITVDIPLQEVTLAGFLTGNGTYAATATIAWDAGELRVGSDNNYFDGTYYGAPATPGTMSNVTDFASAGSVITGTILSTCTLSASISAKNRMTGTILSTCTATASLVTRVQRTATCSSTSVVTGSINDGQTAGSYITGTILSACTLTANMVARTPRTASCTSTCTLAATLRDGSTPVVVPPDPEAPELPPPGLIVAYVAEGAYFLDDEGSPISSNGSTVSASDRIKNAIRLGALLTYDDEILP